MRILKNIKGIMFSFILIALILLVTACTGQTEGDGQVTDGKVYKWRMVTHQIPGTTRYEGTVVPFVEAIEKASGGRLVIELHGGDDLFPTTDTFDAVKDGIVEISAIYSSYWTGKDPVFALAAATFPGDPITEFSEHSYRVEKLQPIIDEVFERHGVKSLGAFDWGPPEILMSKVPIKSLADFKGKNIRASGIASMYYGKLGASAVSLSGPEIYTGLQLGTVDAAEWNEYLVNMEMGFHEVTDYVIEPALHVGATIDKELIVNPDAWNELPDDLKEIVLTARDQARFNSAIAYGTESEKAKQDWIDSGVEVIQLPEDDVEKMKEIGFELINEYRSESSDSEEYIDAYAEVLFELGYVEEASLLGHTE